MYVRTTGLRFEDQKETIYFLGHLLSLQRKYKSFILPMFNETQEPIFNFYKYLIFQWFLYGLGY